MTRKNLLILSSLAVAAVVAGAIALAFFLVIYTGPRMKVDEKIGEFSAHMPAVETGTVAAVFEAHPTTRRFTTGTVDPIDNEESHRRGAVYYGYYCEFCHGGDGSGSGPVGESYVPVPADLRGLALTETELVDRMVTGVGHDPVLPRAVEPRYRPYIAAYVLSLGK